jgi:signal transduction histidine kinase
MQKFNNYIEELNNYTVRHPKTFDDQIKEMENKIGQVLNLQEKIEVDSKEEEELNNSLKKKWEAYQESIRSLSSDETIEKLYSELKQVSMTIIELNQDSIIRKKDNLSNFIMEYRFLISIAILFSLIFGFFTSWVFTGLILTPLNKMTEIVSQFGKTDQTISLHIKGSEEIEKLSEEFNLMTNRLEEYHQSSLGHAITDYENLKRAFDAPPYPLLIFSQDNEIIFMNKMALHLFSVIRNINKKNHQVFYIENPFGELLMKIVTRVQSTRKPYIPEKSEDPIAIVKKEKKNLFLPFAYPIKNRKNHNDPGSTGVLMVLQDVKLQSASEREAEQIFRTFIQDFQAPLAEIQIAIYTSLQEDIGSLTEKQKDILYAARDQSEELERVYQTFLKILENR